uniref:transcriptional regulator FilR1 domain-containing protein n=1 Tax=Halorussus salinisoli TaxID=2558242 RepID=UPI0010C1EB9E|nr:hypothetical protein [Halorussus salinisoli]
MKQAQSGKAILPLVGLHAHEAGYESIVENGAEMELIVSPEVAETLQNEAEYAELTEEMAATGRLHMFKYEGELPYAIVVLDETVQIDVDEAGEPGHFWKRTLKRFETGHCRRLRHINNNPQK